MLTRIGTLGLAAGLLAFSFASAIAEDRGTQRSENKDNDRPELRKVAGQIMSVAKEEVSLKRSEGTAETFLVRPATMITLDGKQAAIQQLRRGDRVEATIGEGNVAQSLTATRSRNPDSIPAVSTLKQVQSEDARDRDAAPTTPADQSDPQKTERREAPAVLGVFLGRSPTTGALVLRVDPESAASRAGLQSGDYILAINGEVISSPDEVQQAIARLGAGEECRLSVWRAGATMQMTASLGERRQSGFRGLSPDAAGLPGFSDRGGEHQMPKAWLGVLLGHDLEGQEGALIRGVFPNGPAARAGFKSDDLVVAVNDEEVSGAEDFIKSLDDVDPGTEIKFQVMRGGEKQAITATLADRSEFPGSSQSVPAPDEEDDDFSIELEHHRRLAEQHQRLEERLDRVLQELQEIRNQLNGKGTSQTPGSETPREPRSN